MKSFFREVLDVFLYTHLFIVGCAVATVHLTTLIFCCFTIDESYYLFVGSGTLVIYNLHRLLSLRKIEKQRIGLHDRFLKINSFKNWYILTSTAGVLVCLWHFPSFDPKMQKLLAAPSILAILYILPIFPSHKRLRDYNFLKIFLIATCWAWLCFYIPLEFYSSASTPEILWLTAQNFLFVFAITLPFDFRDLELDKKQTVATLVSRLGYKNSMILALTLLGFSIGILAYLTFEMYLIETHIFYGIISAYLITGILLEQAFRKHNDYYYTFLIDGSFLIVWIMVFILRNERIILF